MDKREELLEDLNNYVILNGKPPTVSNFHMNRSLFRYGEWTIIKIFGSWNNFIESGGYMNTRYVPKTNNTEDTECIKIEIKKQVEDYINRYGIYPQLRTFCNHSGYKYTKHIVIKVFGSWNNMLEYCGIERYNSGSYIKYRDNNHLLSLLRNAIEVCKTTDRDILHEYGVPTRQLYNARFGSWANALRLCGVDLKQFRYSNKKIAEDGHVVDSVGEEIIDNWLYKHNIRHETQVRYSINRRYTCDFVIDDIYIEYTEAQYIPKLIDTYSKRMEKKREMASMMGVILIEIDSKKKINDMLSEVFTIDVMRK